VKIKKLEQVSVTEVSQFRECRRQWLLGIHLGYTPRSGKPELWFGTLMHSALQVYAVKGVAAAIKFWFKQYDKEITAIAKSYGGLWEQAREMYDEYRELGAGMLTNYDLFVADTGLNMETIQLEQRVWVPIMEPTSFGAKPKTIGVKLTARMDRIVGIGDDHFILDYKTGSQSSGKALDIADQPTGYEYVLWRLTDELAIGVIIEGLMKKLPEEPRILANGDLSTDKRQNTLPGLYKTEMKRRGLMHSAKHMETLEAMVQQGWDGYFEREITYRNLDQLMSYEEHLYYIVKDMQDVTMDPRRAYPSPSHMRCPRCPFLNVCTAMEDGSDYEDILETQFDINEERRW
jgi:PD-(D/E)XK nuclease superfamily